MSNIDFDIKVITAPEFIRTFSSSMFKLKKLIQDGEIKATKRNGRYLIDADEQTDGTNRCLATVTYSQLSSPLMKSRFFSFASGLWRG